MLGLGRKKDDDDDKKDDAQLAQAMRQMSDQIAAMQKTINERDATIADLRKQLGTSQADDKTDDAKIAELQRQLVAAQADDKADDSKAKMLESQIAQLKAGSARISVGSAAAAAKSAAPAASAAPVSGLHVGGAAWVRNVGGKTLRRRDAPGLNASVLDGLNPGTMIALMGGPEQADGYNWWKIITEDNREGWVAGEELVTKPE